MTRFTIGSLTIEVSPTAVMKSYVVLNSWKTSSSSAQRSEFYTFCDKLFPKLMLEDNDTPLDVFCGAAIGHINMIKARHDLRLPAVDAFAHTLRDTLRSPERHANAMRHAQLSSDWLARFAESPYMRLAEQALWYFAHAEVTRKDSAPLRTVYASTESLNALRIGQYVPWLQAISVQMDRICASPYAELNFIETLLHEQVHAIIHEHMGDSGEHYERLPWLNELAAVALSQYALGHAHAHLRTQIGFAEVPHGLTWLRQHQAWGDLATAFMRESGDPRVIWHAWQAIFRLGSYARRNYAHCERLTQILRHAGWDVTFPYHYGGKMVTCRGDWVD